MKRCIHSTSERDPAIRISLSDEQSRILDRVKSGRNLFFTGSAGTGKSVLIRAITEWCRAHRRVLYLTASTGIAGVNIGGTSVHSWAGIGLGIDTAEDLVAKIAVREAVARGKTLARETCEQRIEREMREAAGYKIIYYDAYRRWLLAEVLIIDESESQRSVVLAPTPY